MNCWGHTLPAVNTWLPACLFCLVMWLGNTGRFENISSNLNVIRRKTDACQYFVPGLLEDNYEFSVSLSKLGDFNRMTDLNRRRRWDYEASHPSVIRSKFVLPHKGAYRHGESYVVNKQVSGTEVQRPMTVVGFRRFPQCAVLKRPQKCKNILAVNTRERNLVGGFATRVYVGSRRDATILAQYFLQHEWVNLPVNESLAVSFLVWFAPYTFCKTLYAFNHRRTVIIFTSSVLRGWVLLLPFLSENIRPLDWVRGIHGCPRGVSTGIEPFGVITICNCNIYKGPRSRTDFWSKIYKEKWTLDLARGT